MDTGTYDVYFSDHPVGIARITQSGLYTELICICQCSSSQILRLYQGSACLGVMTPEGGSIVLRKRFSANDLRRLRPDRAQRFELRTDAANTSGWLPCRDAWQIFADPLLAETCRKMTSALTKTEGDVIYLAIPLDPAEPFPLMPVFCFGEICMIDSREHVVFGVRDGEIVI